MKKSLFIFIAMTFSFIQFQAQEEHHYFPTGMKWKEVIVDPFSSLPMDTVFSYIHEIGEDTLVNGKLCKTIISNGLPLTEWVFEEDERVWIITEDYPDPIMIYDFNWHGENVYYEYLRDDYMSNKKELVRSYLNQDEIRTTFYKDHAIEYIMDEGAVIRHLGRVSDMNRSGSLLAYRIYEPVIPGVEFFKVLWIVRDGEEIFRSEAANEWTVDIPNVVHNVPYLDSNPRLYPLYFDLSGRPLNTLPTKGVYIQDGKKWVVR